MITSVECPVLVVVVVVVVLVVAGVGPRLLGTAAYLMSCVGWTIPMYCAGGSWWYDMYCVASHALEERNKAMVKILIKDL